MTTHELKTWPEFFEDILSYKKRFEVRKNDRNFMVNDTLHLREWDNETKKYTGRECKADILSMTNYNCQAGYVVLSISEPYDENKVYDGYIKGKKTIKMYLHGNKDSNYQRILDNKLSFSNEEAERMFLHALCEVEFDVEVDLETGESNIVKVDGREFK